MKIFTLAFISLVFAVSTITAQSITPQVVASSGGYALNGGYSVSWTLGEPVIATAQNGSNTLTQGFQQPTYNVLAITTETLQGFDVNVFPNPTSDYITIDWTTNKENTLYITLFDLAGKMISEKKYSAADEKVSINLSQLASAQYILEVKDKTNSATKIFRIAKK